MRGIGKENYVIASGGTTSPGIDKRGCSMIGIYVPTIDSATITIEASQDGTTYAQMKDATPTVVGQWAASTGAFHLDGDILARFAPYPFLRVVLGAAQTGGARTLVVTFFG